MAQMIEDKSAAKKKKKKMERKKKEEEKIPGKGKEEDGENIKPEESLSPVDDVRAKDAGEGAADPTDSFHPRKDMTQVFRRPGCRI